MDSRTFRLLISAAIALSIVASGCSRKQPTEQPAEKPTLEQAQRIAASSIIVDTHIDVPYRLEEKWEDVTVATEGGDFDYPRALAGGLNVSFMSIYTPAREETEGTSRETADRLIDMVYSIVDAAPEKFAIALSADDVERQFAEGLLSLPLGMENGSPIEGSLDTLQYFFDRGIRYITLTHSLSNHISDSSYDKNRQWGGLSEFGERLVLEMNRLGIMVDISHVSDEAFYDTLKISRAPLIASHSSSRHFTPGFERNMDDPMVKAMAEKGGIIMVNFGSSFLTAEANEYSRKRSDARREFVAAHADAEPSQALREQFRREFEAEHGPYPFADLSDVLDHIDHLVAVAGIDHVGIGSDYDGVGDSLPTGLKDVSTYPNLVLGLLERGHDEFAISKILGLNLLRVWRETERVAAEQETS